MGKCQAVTDSIPCGQEERSFFDAKNHRYYDKGLCYYHEKMKNGLIEPYREDVVVKWNGTTINRPRSGRREV